MEPLTNTNAGVNEIETNQPEQNGATTNVNDQPNKKKHHSSAMYAASMWHSTMHHVKPTHSREGSLPTQE